MVSKTGTAFVRKCPADQQGLSRWMRRACGFWVFFSCSLKKKKKKKRWGILLTGGRFCRLLVGLFAFGFSCYIRRWHLPFEAILCSSFGKPWRIVAAWLHVSASEVFVCLPERARWLAALMDDMLAVCLTQNTTLPSTLLSLTCCIAESPEVLFSSPSRIGSSLRPSPLCTALWVSGWCRCGRVAFERSALSKHKEIV